MLPSLDNHDTRSRNAAARAGAPGVCHGCKMHAAVFDTPIGRLCSTCADALDAMAERMAGVDLDSLSRYCDCGECGLDPLKWECMTHD